MKTDLQQLCALEGVSGREDAVRAYILEKLSASSAVIQVSVDALGNVLAEVRGERRAARRLLFAAHMDEVGFIVTGATDDGFLRFAPVGGIDASVVFSRKVRVNGHGGVIGGKAIHQCAGDEKKTAVPIDQMLIDVAADSREEAQNIAKPGDVAVFDSGYVRLAGGRFKARALDDRAGCALLLALAEQTPAYDFSLAFTVQEEVGLRGAKAAAYAMKPEIAVVVDSTTASDTAGVPEEKQVCRVGGGPVVSFMDRHTLYDKALYDEIMETAERIRVPAQTKTMVTGGNDAGSIQRSRAGVRVAAVSLPCRYIHSPSCVLSEKDFDAAEALLKELASVLASGREGIAQ